MQKNVDQGTVIPELMKAMKSPVEIIEELYIRALTRKPKPDELQALLARLSSAGVSARWRCRQPTWPTWPKLWLCCGWWAVSRSHGWNGWPWPATMTAACPR